MSAAEPLHVELVAVPVSGRTFATTRRVSVDDADPAGRMELDAVLRYVQDVGNDDTDDAGLGGLGLAWIARKAVIEVGEPASVRELLTITTWCSGTGSHWAERRTQIRGDRGARVDVAAIWVRVDAATGRPTRWSDQFGAAYLESAAGRRVEARLRHDKRPPEQNLEVNPWSFRRTDMDSFGHVNNAAYLAVLEEIALPDERGAGRWIEIEWRKPSVANEPLDIVSAGAHDSRNIWLMSDEETRATIRVKTLSSGNDESGASRPN